MKCPFCSFKNTKVLDKRDSEDLSATRRRRECERCKKRFTTYERVELINLLVIKKDGAREQFDREKIKKGIIRSCQKRPIGIDQIERIVDQIEARIRSRNQKEIRSTTIGELVLVALQRVDQVAFIRFASVYRSFEDISSFEKELKRLRERKKNRTGKIAVKSR